ncbi:MAG: class I SAM-dependent methyltransferase [Promethearchaeota archaeon]
MFIQKPKKIAERITLKPGMIVVEIGPGKGNYTKIIAEKILPGGLVYAVDIQVPIIEKLREKIEKENIPNIIPKIDDAYKFSFEDRSVDRVFANTYLSEISDPVKMLQECRRILKKDGIISLCEMALDPDYPWRKTEKK